MNEKGIQPNIIYSFQMERVWVLLPLKLKFINIYTELSFNDN